MRIRIILTLLLCVNTLFAQVDLKKAHLYKADINSKQAFEMQQKGALLIDVRTPREYKFLHPKGAINIPIFTEKYGQRVLNKSFADKVDYALQDNDKKVILICRSGSRTKFAANLLANEGFSNVYNVKKGFLYDWKRAKLPVEK
jgi:rhodanese-related sulfurtransferase